MGFSDAVKSALSKYIVFEGRASRAEYWWFILFQIIVSIVTMVLDGLLGTVLILNSLAMLGLLLPSIMVSIRRLHDTDRSGWWLLIVLIPLIGAIVLLVFTLLKGTEGPNRFGNDPYQE